MNSTGFLIIAFIILCLIGAGIIFFSIKFFTKIINKGVARDTKAVKEAISDCRISATFSRNGRIKKSAIDKENSK